MGSSYLAVGIYDDHRNVDAALSGFLRSGFDAGQLSVVGKEHHRDLCPDDYSRSADRARYAGKFDSFWIAGFLTAAIAHGLEGASPMTSLSALGVGLFSQGIPLAAAAECEAAVRADRYLLIVSGSAADTNAAAAVMLSEAIKVQLHAGKVNDLEL